MEPLVVDGVLALLVGSLSSDLVVFCVSPVVASVTAAVRVSLPPPGASVTCAEVLAAWT